jgi:hypothetical protein
MARPRTAHQISCGRRITPPATAAAASTICERKLRSRCHAAASPAFACFNRRANESPFMTALPESRTRASVNSSGFTSQRGVSRHSAHYRTRPERHVFSGASAPSRLSSRRARSQKPLNPGQPPAGHRLESLYAWRTSTLSRPMLLLNQRLHDDAPAHKNEEKRKQRQPHRENTP